MLQHYLSSPYVKNKYNTAKSTKDAHKVAHKVVHKVAHKVAHKVVKNKYIAGRVCNVYPVCTPNTSQIHSYSPV